MKLRALLECTVDTANPADELIAVINVVLNATPAHQREAVLRALDTEIGVALAQFETEADA